MGALEQYPRITPFLWFDANAEEAVDFYCSVFKNSRKHGEFRTPDGKVLTIGFELEGLKFTALNGGPMYKFNESVSFVVRCDTQAEIDEYWSKLIAGGSDGRCGWLKDKFGLSWQIVPGRIGELLQHPKAMEALMEMEKIDIGALERAGKS